MSEESLELVRDAIEAFDRGDLEWPLNRLDDDLKFGWTRSRGPLAIYGDPHGLTEFLREQIPDLAWCGELGRAAR